MTREKKELPLLVFPEGKSSKVLKALNTVSQEKIMRPVLFGYESEVREKIDELELEYLKDIPIHRPSTHPKYKKYVETLYKMRQRKGVTQAEAERLLNNPHYFASMAVHAGDANGMISGATENYADCVRPILEIIGTTKDHVASGLILMLFKDKMYFLADTTVNINPTAEQIAISAIHASKVAQYFKVEPRIAMLSYSNFVGKKETPRKMKEAAQIVKQLQPNLTVDGEMQADTAVNPNVIEQIFPFSEIKNGANILMFPNLDSGNIAYKLIQQLSEGEVLGPFLMGVKKPANVLQRTCSVDDIINTIVLTAIETHAYPVGK